MNKCERWWDREHDWSKWIETSRGEIISNISNGVIGHFILLERVYNRCGLKEIKKQSI